MPIILIGILGGTLLAAGLKALFDIGSTVAANRYNSPAAMKRRLQKAGLPLAFMYQGRVAQQSSVPQLSIDPTLGTLAKKQGSKLDADTQEQLEETQAKGFMSGIKNEDGSEYNLRVQEKIDDVHRRNAERFTKEYEKELAKIELDVERDAFGEGVQLQQKREALEKAKQQVKNLLAQAGLMEQLKKIRGFEELLNSSLTEDLESMPEWISALLKILLIATKR